MMDELKDVKRTLNPTEVLLVVDAMTGQEAAGNCIILLFFKSLIALNDFVAYIPTLVIFTALVTTFNLEIGITGAILTKLDGDSRGGAALSVKEVSLLQ